MIKMSKLIKQQNDQIRKQTGMIKEDTKVPADIKIFMTADEDIRAQRRFDELQYKDNAPSMVEIKENIKKRDYIDSHRKISPLKKADDAIILDNSTLTTVAQFNLAVELINNRLSK